MSLIIKSAYVVPTILRSRNILILFFFIINQTNLYSIKDLISFFKKKNMWVYRPQLTHGHLDESRKTINSFLI